MTDEDFRIENAALKFAARQVAVRSDDYRATYLKVLYEDVNHARSEQEPSSPFPLQPKSVPSGAAHQPAQRTRNLGRQCTHQLCGVAAP